jgi:hypothetical protein
MQRRGFSITAALGWSVTWAIGVAVGVALGAYITVLGAAAAPGEVTLDSTELLFLPLVSGAAVFVLSMTVRLVLALLRRLLPSREPYKGAGD